MWKQEEPTRSVTPQVKSTAGLLPAGGEAAPTKCVLVGKSVVVKGELHGGEDVTI